VIRRRYLEVAETLRAMLRDGRWRAGDKLPPERALAQELDVPRATVREALIVLEVDALIEVRHASGIYVRNPSVLPAAITPNLQPDDIGPFELLRARQVIESGIAAAAALSVTDAQIAAMEAALEQEESDVREGRGSYEGDALFHHLVAEATQNTALVASIELLWTLRERSELWKRLHTRIFDDSYRRNWAADHREILLALRRREPDDARAAMWRHLGNVRGTLLDLSDMEVFVAKVPTLVDADRSGRSQGRKDGDVGAPGVNGSAELP